MGFVSAKHDLLVHQISAFDFFCVEHVGVYPLHLHVLDTTVIFLFLELNVFGLGKMKME